MTVLAVALGALAVAMALGRTAGGAQRLSRLSPSAPTARPGLSGTASCLVAGIAMAALVGLPAGLVMGAGVAVAGPRVLARLEPAADRRKREHLVRELPLLLDLLAACLAGGASLASAASVVAAALPGPCADRLTAVADGLAAGCPAPEAWLALTGGSPDDPLAATARLLARASDGGTPVAAAVGRLATEARAASTAAGAQAARRVGVLVVAPLGLCFLPAFVLLGIVPVVAGLAAPLLRAF